MWCFKAHVAVRDYMTGSLGKRRRAARKIRVRISQELDTMQHTSEKELVFTKSHDPNNISVAK